MGTGGCQILGCQDLTTKASPDPGPGEQPGAGGAQERPQVGDGAQPGGSGRAQLSSNTRPKQTKEE